MEGSSGAGREDMEDVEGGTGGPMYTVWNQVMWPCDYKRGWADKLLCAQEKENEMRWGNHNILSPTSLVVFLYEWYKQLKDPSSLKHSTPSVLLDMWNLHVNIPFFKTSKSRYKESKHIPWTESSFISFWLCWVLAAAGAFL